jgi:hypothetical protein
MNDQDVQSAIADFRKSWKEDLGCRVRYGKRSVVPSGGFSIDKNTIETISWLDTTPKGDLYATVKSMSKEELIDCGMNTSCTAVITCIFEDILSLQDDIGGTKRLVKEKLINDKIQVLTKGVKQTFDIVDFQFAFQLRDTYVFLKLGVVNVLGDDDLG